MIEKRGQKGILNLLENALSTCITNIKNINGTSDLVNSKIKQNYGTMNYENYLFQTDYTIQFRTTVLPWACKRVLTRANG